MKYVKLLLSTLILAAVHILIAEIGKYAMLSLVFELHITFLTVAFLVVYTAIYLAIAVYLAVNATNLIAPIYFAIMAAASLLCVFWDGFASIFKTIAFGAFAEVEGGIIAPVVIIVVYIMLCIVAAASLIKHKNKEQKEQNRS